MKDFIFFILDHWIYFALAVQLILHCGLVSYYFHKLQARQARLSFGRGDLLAVILVWLSVLGLTLVWLTHDPAAAPFIEFLHLFSLPVCVLGVLYARLRVALRVNKDRFRTSLFHIIATLLCSVAVIYLLFGGLILITLWFIF